VSTYYTTLEQESLLHINGPDSATFLQGQTSCDTRQLDASTALPGAYCTPQGRVVCDFLLCEAAENHCLLRMRRDIRQRACETFGKYIIFSKAELSATDDWHTLACWGSGAADALARVFGAAPAGRYGALRGDGFLLVQVDDEASQFECYLRDDGVATWSEQLADGAQLADENSWRALQLRNGVARIEAATIEEFVPQMLNYDLTGHINFSKGCYTGQEVVARLHYRGKSKRRMYLASSAAGPVAAGTPLYSPAAQQSVGNVVNSASGEDDTGLALLVATAEGHGAGLHLESADGPLFTPEELPYSLPSE
jgi:folate-binding protein YgfZ